MSRFKKFSFVVIAIFFGFLCASRVSAATYYLSPSGGNANAGTSESAPWKTFAKAFSSMAGGDELILLDGTYSEATGTGYISYLGTNSAQPPSGSSESARTYVHAKNSGSVKIVGPLFLGRSTRKDSYIKIQGITFEGGSSGEGSLYNTSYVYIKDCGFHGTAQDGGGVFGIGTNDGSWGNSYNLIEDVWIWGKNRIIAANYRAHNNIWRRVVIRGDGCNTADCTGSGNPNVGITVYDSSYVTLENILVVDRILGGGEPYSDFAVAQHTSGFPFGGNKWLGTLSLNAPDGGYYFEPDEVSINPSFTLRDCVAWNSAGGGINIARTGTVDMQNCTIRTVGDDGLRLAPELGSSGHIVRNLIVTGNGRFGSNSSFTPSYLDLYGTWSESDYNQTVCSVGCKTTNPLSDGNPASLKHITRIESGSALKGTGYSGGDYGANIVYRYGVDGTRYGETGSETLTGTLLWPYPNEVRIKKEMCTDTGITRGFCSDSSLTHYIMNQLGNGDPYSGSTPVFSACSTVTTSNFSQSAYNAYGAPFDAFQTTTNLVDAKCTSSDTHTINLTTGITGDTTRIVYTKGYYYDPVTSGWTQYSGTCNGALNGEWCQGSISATITSPNISTASASNPTYLVGMTCSVQGGSWKCGCRDTTCANFSWQVQGAGQ